MANTGNISVGSIQNVPRLGKPAVVIGTIFVGVDGLGIRSSSVVSSPAVCHVSLGGFGISNDRSKVGVPAIYPTTRTNEINPLVEFQVPEFIQENHREFLFFMRQYYRFTEKQNGPLHFLRRLLDIQDVDRTVGDLLDYFFKEYCPSFPRDVALSPAIIIKNIRQFYQAKGSEKSFRFLFRVLFGQEIDFYYPRLDILRFSDAKWVEDRTIKCVLISGDPSVLIGNRIVGTDSRASAFVEKVLFTQDGPISSYELYLNRSSIVGKFNPNERVENQDGSCTLRALPMLTKIAVTTKGKGYKQGQEITINGDGFNCRARIASVNGFGEVESVQLYQFGAGYNSDSTSIVFPMYDGVAEQATGKPVFDVITRYAGYFLNSDGMFSSLKRIQDGHYYQQYSYVIRSEESRNRYEDSVKRLAHPAGFVFFSEVFSESVLDVSSEIPAAADGSFTIEAEIFTDLRCDYNEFEIPATEYVFQEIDSGEEIDAEVEILIEDVTYDSSNRPLGPTWADWDQWKTDYRPTPVGGLPSDEIIQPGYYSLYANTPLKAFADVPLAEIANHERNSIDHVSEAAVYQFACENYEDISQFPITGDVRTIYSDQSTNKTYLWLAPRSYDPVTFPGAYLEIQ